MEVKTQDAVRELRERAASEYRDHDRAVFSAVVAYVDNLERDLDAALAMIAGATEQPEAKVSDTFRVEKS